MVSQLVRQTGMTAFNVFCTAVVGLAGVYQSDMGVLSRLAPPTVPQRQYCKHQQGINAAI